MVGVFNKHHYKNKPLPPNSIYVGRPTKWGNPFSHLPNTLAKFRVETRDEAVKAYEDWMQTQPDLLDSLAELSGKDLLCWCAPASCHADVLIRLANAENDTQDVGGT